jgi:hypothetical protein
VEQARGGRCDGSRPTTILARSSFDSLNFREP